MVIEPCFSAAVGKFTPSIRPFIINYCFGNMQSSQENLKTIVYAEFGGQTKCVMGNWKIENVRLFVNPLTTA